MKPTDTTEAETYQSTAYGTCPDCEERYPGHIYTHEIPANPPAWVCPECGHAATPVEVGAEHIEEPEGEA